MARYEMSNGRVRDTAKRYYIAYGSNLNVQQMRMRCPHATILGTAELKGWELLFKGSKTRSYLTIEEREGGSVPVVIWEVTDSDEKALDRYEGFPSFYYKKELRLQYRGIRTGRRRTVTPDAGKYGLSSVTVAAIPAAYQDVTSVTATAGDVLANKVIIDSTGQTVAGTIPVNGAIAATFDPLTESSVAIAAGYTSGGAVTLTSDLEDALAAI